MKNTIATWLTGAALIQADVKKIGGTAVYASPAGKNLGKGTVVLGAKYTF